MPARFTKLSASGREPIGAKLGLQQLVPQVARPDPSVPFNSESESDETAEQIAQRGGPLEAPTPGEQPPAQPGDESRFTGLPRDYKLGPGDQISVIDPSIGSLEAPSTSIHTLGPDGTVTIYPIGVIRAAGLSVPQLNDVVNQKASAFIRNPRISIALLKTRPITVYVLGDVLSPGLWSNGQSPATERERQQAQNLAIAQQGMGSITNMQRQSRFFGRTDPTSTQIPAVVSTATPTMVEPEPAVQAMTALTAIQLAGGIKETADIRNITVRKQGGRIYNVDLWRLLALGDFEQDVLLQSGDVVYVPTGGPDFAADKLGMAANQFRYVRVWGEVRNPGLYMLTPKDDAFSIIARAGGFTDKANMRKVQLSRVRRDGSIQYLELPIKAALEGTEPAGRVKVMPGDVLIARPSYIKKMGPKIWETVAVAGGAILLLYLSRTIKDRSLPAGTNTTSVNLF
jgi:polysaccharide export outer membrane protein